MFDPCDQRASLNKSDTLSICQLSSIMSERGSPRASYTASFKLRVLAFATDKGNRAAGKQFNVDESCVRRWRSQREKLFETPRNKRALRGRSAAFPELEKEVAEWITEKRKAGTGVSTNIIRLKSEISRPKAGIGTIQSVQMLVLPLHGSIWLLHQKANNNCSKTSSRLRRKVNQVSALRVG